MRTDVTFIGIEVADAAVSDAAIAAKLEEVCPCGIFAADGGTVSVVEKNVDECVLCRLCLDATPAGTVKVLKLYDGEAVL
jgi:NAD-dependent dihydropyrimidine dehydrogenase PreA subunit